jgi:Spy/CpxP family protein refolding chaperone
MKKWMLHAAVFAAGALAAAFAWPQEKPPKRHGLSAVYEELGLAPAVAPELQKLDEKVGPVCRAIAEKRRALYGELRKDPHDAVLLSRFATEIAELRAQMQRDVVEHLVAVKARLTPEQRERLFTRLSETR